MASFPLRSSTAPRKAVRRSSRGRGSRHGGQGPERDRRMKDQGCRSWERPYSRKPRGRAGPAQPRWAGMTHGPAWNRVHDGLRVESAKQLDG